LLLGSLLLLSACDSTTSSGGATTTEGTGLVGAWKMPAGTWSVRHMVFRADGTGKTVTEMGSRRLVVDFAWTRQGDSLFVTASDSTQHLFVRMAGESLTLTSKGLYGFTNQAVFQREAEPNLVASEGDRPATAVGDWRRTVLQMVDSYTGDSLTGTDTLHNQEQIQLDIDGSAHLVDWQEGDICDAGGTCTPGLVPGDSTLYRWWTSGTDLYLQLKRYVPADFPEAAQDLGESGSIQVTGWSVVSDSLRLKSYTGDSLVQVYGRAR
jgi:hypothetical protein